jgi:hypothetical protein
VLEHSSDGAKEQEMSRHVPHYFEESHHSKLMIPVNELDTLLSEARATDGGQLQFRMYSSERAGNSGSVQVARRFARDE